MAHTDAAFMAKPICTIGVTYDKSIKAMNTALAQSDTGAGANLIHSALVPPE